MNFTPTLTVDFGQVRNPPGGPNGAQLAVECNALVLNSGVNHSADKRPNSFIVKVKQANGTSVIFPSNTLPAILVEPAGNLVKQEVASSSPSRVAYSLSYTNSGTATAFDVHVHDLLPTPLTLVTATASPSSCTVNPALAWAGRRHLCRGVSGQHLSQSK